MFLEMTCASLICFAPELNLYKLSGSEHRVEAHWPSSIEPNRLVNIQDIVISSGLPLRYLTESEQAAVNRALYRSVKIIHKGRPYKA